jgi:hypothetical protein
MVDFVHELMLTVLGGIAVPATRTALRLRSSVAEGASAHGRLGVPALRGRVSKTCLFDELGWTLV